MPKSTKPTSKKPSKKTPPDNATLSGRELDAVSGGITITKPIDPPSTPIFRS